VLTITEGDCDMENPGVEYIDGSPDKGIRQKGEIMRSHGWGWILCRRDRGLLLEVLMGGISFDQKYLLLTPAEESLFSTGGREYIAALADRVRNYPFDFASRFSETHP